MRITIPETLQSLASVFTDAGAPVYLVGGYVRNTLLGLPPSDMDICSMLHPSDLMELCRERDIQVIPKAVEFGTVEIHYGGHTMEHTTFRGDLYATGGSHRPENVWFSEKLTDDAVRRDFSVNALYADLTTGEISDPTGGLKDLKERVLRTTAPAPDVILRSDALRILRLARFAGELGFRVDVETGRSARRNADLIDSISYERRRDELNKILMADVKYGQGGGAVLEGLLLLMTFNAWQYIIPELVEGQFMRQRPDFHRFCVMEHALHAAAAAPPQLELRLAAMLHDVGKPDAFLKTGRFLTHDKLGAPIARAILTRLRYPADTVEEVGELVRIHMFDIQGTARDSTLRKRFVQWGRERTRQAIALREADIRGCGTNDGYVNTRWRELYEKMQRENVPFGLGELALDGRDVMESLSIPAGPQVGEQLKKLLLHCAVKPKDNTPQALRRILEETAGPAGKAAKARGSKERASGTDSRA